MASRTSKAVKALFTAAEPRCGGCDHFRPYESDTKIVTEGSCRRYPPTWRLDEDGDEISGWPTVVPDEFGCGEFKAAQ